MKLQGESPRDERSTCIPGVPGLVWWPVPSGAPSSTQGGLALVGESDVGSRRKQAAAC